MGGKSLSHSAPQKLAKSVANPVGTAPRKKHAKCTVRLKLAKSANDWIHTAANPAGKAPQKKLAKSRVTLKLAESASDRIRTVREQTLGQPPLWQA